MDARDVPPAPDPVLDWPHTAGEDDPPSVTWRLRIRVDDRPGTLARVAIRLADLGCNILGLTVLPVPGGVLDEVVLRPPIGLTPAQLVTALRGEGCDCVGLVEADLRDLVDAGTAALAAATRAVVDPAHTVDAIREVLAADLVTVVPADEANPGRTEGGHRAVLPLGPARVLVARRRWAPFAQLELARARALAHLMAAVADNASGPVVLTCADGAALVLRLGGPADVDAVAALHGRCSAGTLFRRYHTDTRTVPRRWLQRLLLPPRGLSVLAGCGRDVVGLGQLIPRPGETVAEVSLLVEDAWQRRGVGTGLVRRLAVLAAARGYRELLAVHPPDQDVVRRAVLRAGLPVTAEAEGAVRVTLPAPGAGGG
ncbi:ACT domain-containing protein [Amycolatopsis arida]|uniref:ACT domain-containing protein n=1 Tax=Amycolatopsis arida TaxID=587909 RepID=A0A1I5XRA2_9PSEU|nr:GNAT family N-acetyltransferase [Amycolatopsis arida]TDX97306.1 acetyltransferase (GNAT) family protein [Amycolatopsis arida]SFQ34492.1 ACT domain-containing protein [Amycolatopsis arida]